MPELPEVETIKRIIELQIIGSVIQKVEVRNEQVIAHPAAENFAQSRGFLVWAGGASF